MAGLVPAIHVLRRRTKTWMPATSAGMTNGEVVALCDTRSSPFFHGNVIGLPQAARAGRMQVCQDTARGLAVAPGAGDRSGEAQGVGNVRC